MNKDLAQKIFKVGNDLYIKSVCETITKNDCLDVETKLGKLADEVKQALTPPNLNDLRDEIIKELNELYEVDNYKYGRSPNYSNGSYALRFTSNDNGLYVKAEYDVKSKSINISGYTPLNTAHKITKYFKLLSEVE